MAPRRRSTAVVDPDPDVVELIALYRWADESGQWDQQAYALLDPDRPDPTYCVAGRTVVRAGHRVYWERPTMAGKIPWAWHIVQMGGPEPGGRGHRIDFAAQRILGLTNAQADDLFCETNTLWDIRMAVYEITGVDPGGPAECGETHDHEAHPMAWPVEPPARPTFCTGRIRAGVAVHG